MWGIAGHGAPAPGSSDVAQWSARYGGEKLTVSREFNEREDMVVEGDQAALCAAQFVGAEGSRILRGEASGT